MSADALDQDREECSEDALMKRGLFSAAKKPARRRDIQHFKTLHSPRIHGMAEWILQYERVCRQQNFYLQQIKELRQQFKHQDSWKLTRPDTVRTGDSMTARHPGCSLKVPQAPPTKWNKEFSNSFCVVKLKKERGRKTDRTDMLRSHDSSKLLPDSELSMTSGNAHVATFSITPARCAVMFPPICALERYNTDFEPVTETDYEPFENLANRNKLNLGVYFGRR